MSVFIFVFFNLYAIFLYSLFHLSNFHYFKDLSPQLYHFYYYLTLVTIFEIVSETQQPD